MRALANKALVDTLSKERKLTLPNLKKKKRKKIATTTTDKMRP